MEAPRYDALYNKAKKQIEKKDKTKEDYEFEITKTSAGWKVTSSGMVIGTFKDADYIKWDFESQLAKYTPKVLG